MRPICIDLFCGLGGWTRGFLSEGYQCIGFDIEQHVYGENRYPAQLVLQDVLTLHGAQFRNAACIVASPPCQEYSYMAMPWSRAKQIAGALRREHGTHDGKRIEFPEGYTGSRTVEELTALFDACFRIQREASEAAGRHIPLVVENVKGAQPWVGRANANFGSFYLWGDVRSVGGRIVAAHCVEFGAASVKALRGQKFNPDGTQHGQGSWFAVADSKNRGARKPDAIKVPGLANGTFPGGGLAQGYLDQQQGRKVPGMNFHDHEKGKPGRSFQSAAVEQNRSEYGHSQEDSSVPALLRDYDRTRIDGSRGDLSGLSIPGAEDPRGILGLAAQVAAQASTVPSSAGLKSAVPRAWFNDHKIAGVAVADHERLSRTGSKSSVRKAASAAIAEIPFELAAHIARCFKPADLKEGIA